LTLAKPKLIPLPKAAEIATEVAYIATAPYQIIRVKYTKMQV